MIKFDQTTLDWVFAQLPVSAAQELRAKVKVEENTFDDFELDLGPGGEHPEVLLFLTDIGIPDFTISDYNLPA